MNYSKGINTLYKQLFSKEWKGKYIWECIRDKELSAAPAFIGTAYGDAPLKIMIVGRAVNGWQVDFCKCDSCDDIVKAVLTQENIMDEFAKDYVIDEVTNKKYHYAKSSFLRLIKNLVVVSSGCVENWQQKIVWSNLFKIAPRNGGKNPSWLMIRDNIHIYSEIIKNEIGSNSPDLVVFVTDENFINPYPNNRKYGNFLGLFNSESIYYDNLPECISFIGRFIEDNNINMIVCKRPEYRSAQKMAEEIYNEYRINNGTNRE